MATIKIGSQVILRKAGNQPELANSGATVTGSYVTACGEFAPEIRGVNIRLNDSGRAIRGVPMEWLEVVW